MSTLTYGDLITAADAQAAGLRAPQHRAPYDEMTDRIRRRCSQVPAQHAAVPALTAEVTGS